ncbi:endoglycosylceramidase [Mycolicibacterium sp. BK556]|uniref:cellulase family glycosylhydrolase n=1 Tax=unclassified Mycolicibacterium TaxID=2636767 RepID=UPI001849D83D|nr:MULTISPECIES: cellulase family glycosylhydrolase [unclassified Mycolicibacterium]MBB3606079.1 endoglycosylceramidase [Mycolicibacterium sp. BK556]MBB3632656.1 endoglycosylceramidase [Mycolicibacterium sp. BK607]
MNASAHIGRVGGLAIALGIGAAVASASAVAWADADGSASGHSTSASAGGHAGPRAAKAPAGAKPKTPTQKSATPRSTTRTTARSMPASAVAAQITAPPNLTAVVQQAVYTPLHAVVQAWIVSEVGRQVDDFINKAARSYVIGNGAPGTEQHHDGGAGGWLLGDGGAGWHSTEDGVVGGNGGAAGAFGNGGAGGGGGAGAAGGDGGAGGRLMGIGGDGGAGGAGAAGAAGGVGGAGGDGAGLVFGVGGHGGAGGDGSDGGRGGNGGNGAEFLGSGGDGGNAGKSNVGGVATGLPALGGAGGTAGWLGSHGAVGNSGATAAATTPSGSLPPVSSVGTWLTTSDGQVVILHGLNEVYKLAPYEPSASGFNEADAQFLADNGFNVVRLGVIWAGVEPQPGVIDTAYLDSIQQTVQMLADHGIYTIIDMHQDLYSSTYYGEGAPEWASYSGGRPNKNSGFPGNYYVNAALHHAWDAFWGNADAPNGIGLQDNYALVWQRVATYFNGNAAVIGYDIMNEPMAGSTYPIALLGGSFFATQQLTPMYNQVAAAIRSVDATTALYLEPPNPAVTEVPTLLGLPVALLGHVTDPNIVLAFHNYCGPIGGVLCTKIVDTLAVQAENYSKQHNIPALMNEFGATSDAPTLTKTIRSADRYLMGWAEWAYTGVGDITGSPDVEALVYDPAKDPTGDNVNAGNLAILSSPYPQVVSGTPSVWSFSDGTFEFGYSTAKVDGSGSFAAGSLSTISVPEVQYPNGYQVTVTGGHVVSAANAARLVIASDPGATAVQVVVSPAA